MASSWDPEPWSEKVQIHAFLMIAAWGFFLPVGLVTQSHLRTASSSWKQRKFGNHCHMSSMTVGVLMALAGFWYGVRNLTTFTRNPQYVTHYAMVHAVLGTIVTFLMIVGVLLVGMVRTVQPEDDRYEDWPTWRKVGSFTYSYWTFFPRKAHHPQIMNIMTRPPFQIFYHIRIRPKDWSCISSWHRIHHAAISIFHVGNRDAH